MKALQPMLLAPIQCGWRALTIREPTSATIIVGAASMEVDVVVNAIDLEILQLPTELLTNQKYPMLVSAKNGWRTGSWCAHRYLVRRWADQQGHCGHR